MAPGHLFQMTSRLECWISLKRLARLTRRTGEEPMILNRRHGLDLGLVLLCSVALRYALMPSTLRSYSLMTLSRTTLSITGLGKWPSSSAITLREYGQVDAAWG